MSAPAPDKAAPQDPLVGCGPNTVRAMQAGGARYVAPTVPPLCTAPSSVCRFDSLCFVARLLDADAVADEAHIRRAVAAAIGVSCAGDALAAMRGAGCSDDIAAPSPPDPDDVDASDFGALARVEAHVAALRFAQMQRLGLLQVHAFMRLFHSAYRDVLHIDPDAVVLSGQASPSTAMTDGPLTPLNAVRGPAAAPHGSFDLPSQAMPLSEAVMRFTQLLHSFCQRVTQQVEELAFEPPPQPTEEEKAAAAAAAAELVSAQPKGRGAKRGSGAQGDGERPKTPPPPEPECAIRRLVSVVRDPVFSPREARAIMGYVSTTLFQHWRLFKAAAKPEARPVARRTVELVVEDLPRVQEPLDSAVPLAVHDMKMERLAMVAAYEAAVAADYDDVAAAVARIHADLYTPHTAAAVAEDDARREEDARLAMNPEEYQWTIGVMKRRAAGLDTLDDVAEKEGTEVSPTRKTRNATASLLQRLDRLEQAATARFDAPPPKGKK